MEQEKEASDVATVDPVGLDFVSPYDIIRRQSDRDTIQSAEDEKTHFVGLPGISGVSLSNSEIPALQRASGERRWLGAWPISADAGY